MIGAIVLFLILLASLRSLASIYTDSLWFSSVNYHDVFSSLLAIKLGLFGVFGAIFFVVLWINLVVCDRLAHSGVDGGGEDELVRRYQQYVRPYAGRLYVALAFVLALIAASGTVGEWQNWILFRHGGNFNVTDPQFHKDVGFYVFKLPFMSFVVDWTLAILIVVLAVSVVFHYLNGGIVPQRGLPRVRPAVKAHLSVMLALIALTKAAGYVLQRWSMVNAQDGYVNGAGYADVNARLPAQTLLIVISIFAAAILLYNIRQQGWTLPVLAVGIWAFVALVVGVIYPALLQAIKVNPAQASLEAPYIKRNIEATTAAYGLQNVHVHTFQAAKTITPATLGAPGASATLANVRQWDPDPSISLQTIIRQQQIRSYYTFPSVSVDRYTVGGQMTPVLVGVRTLSTLPAPTWVNTHLEFTHGYGVVVAEANQTSSDGPAYAVSNVPTKSSNGLPKVTQPGVYFGLGDTGFVVANTKQAEVDYQRSDSSNVESHYTGKDATGGVQLNSFLTKAAFALRLGSFNLLISSQITDKSRIMFVRDPVQMAQKAAPFLSFDNDPYAVIDNGHIDWVVDGYTTTNQYPYSENADTQQVPLNNGLPASYNYVRNSVKVIIDAYSGQMTFYAADPNDPILKAYEAAFPHMFTPLSKMSSNLQAHLRYPEDIFSIQSAIYGRYHLTNPSDFYSASNAWQLSQTAGAGPASSSQGQIQVNTVNSQGQVVSSNPARMSPLYQVMAVPGATQPSFTISEAYVPASQSNTSSESQNYNLTAFMIANSDPAKYGQFNVYETPSGTTGPANADAEISSDSAISTKITQLDQKGSEVLFGNTLLLPIGNSVVYLRPMYTSPTANVQPTLQYMIGVVGRNVYFETTLAQTLSDIFQTTVSTPAAGQGTAPSTAPVSGSLPAAVQNDLNQAQTDYKAAQTHLQQGNLGQYQTDIANMASEITAAQNAAQAAAGTATGATTTPTTAPKSTTKTTTKSTTRTTVPTSTEPKGTTTTTTPAAAAKP